MNKISRVFIILFLLLIYILGSYFSFTTGISHDQFHENYNVLLNIQTIKELVNFGNSALLSNYQDKYMGIGFSFISYPIQIFFTSLIKSFFSLPSIGVHYLIKNFIIFNIFYFSAYLIYLIFIDLIKNKFASFVAASLYLTYPVFFGHSLINPKDIPFSVVWLLCTFVSFKIVKSYLRKSFFYYKDIILLSFFTAYLVSVRFAGLLILVQYFFLFIILINTEKIDFIKFIKSEFNKIILFIIIFIFLIIFFYPSIWTNPLDLYSGIKFSTKFYNDVCTFVFGKCLKASNLPPTYIPIWLILKLPIIVLVGILYLFFNDKKILFNKINKIFLGTIICTIIFIYIFIILFNVRIYNEIRHLLFLINLFFIIGVASLFYLNKKIFFISSMCSVLFFVIEMVYIHPYQYSWFNSPSRFLDLQKNFEFDYWGVSNRNLYNYLNKNENLDRSTCVYGDGYIEIFLNDFTCKKHFAEASQAKRPFFAVQNARNNNRNLPDCLTLYEEKFRFLFYKKDLVVGKVIKCV